MVKLQDIAQAAGVTIATASRSMNARYGVNPDTRERVLAAASRLGYQPNRLARGLVTGRSQLIGLIVSDIRNPFFSEVARGVQDAAYLSGSDIVLCNSDLDPQKQSQCINSMMARNVDGIIMNSVATLREADVERLAHSGVPVVLLNQRSHPWFSTVSADNEEGGRLAADYLLRSGHRRLAHLTGRRQHINLAKRAQAFVRTVREQDSGASVMVLHGAHTLDGGYSLALRLFREKRRPTAIFAANDVMAFGVLKAARECQLRVPEDISLIGFDNVEMSALVGPPLTTVHQPKSEIGQAAVNILTRLSKGKQESPENRTLGVELIARGSVLNLRKKS